MAVPTLLELAEAGAHFGHHRSLIYPKARKFVYMIKNDVALINLEQTQESIRRAQEMLAECRAANKSILFVGTKRSVRNSVKEVAESIGAAYITERWFGGTLTNFETILANIKKMNELQEFLSQNSDGLTKKERLRYQSRLNRYHRFLGGLKNLKTMPELIVLASATEDKIAIKEAKQFNIPIIAITDTDMNPDDIACPIPANDDAPRAVDLILRSIVEAPTVAKEKKSPAAALEGGSKTAEKKKKTAKKESSKKTAKASKK
jgi:small subunit ribosomal protein S2